MGDADDDGEAPKIMTLIPSVNEAEAFAQPELEHRSGMNLDDITGDESISDDDI